MVRILSLAALLLLGGCATSAPVEVLGERLRTPDRHVMIVAHRGCWKTTAENSLAAIRACRALGIDMVELDVRRTRDGDLVLMHDETVDRTTNGRGAVAELTLAEINALRLRAGAGGEDAPVTEESVPTFEEALQAARGGVLINVDAKSDIYDQVIATLSRMNMLDHVLLKSPLKPDDPAQPAAALRQAAFFMPIISQARGFGPIAEVLPNYRPLAPVAYEIVFEDETYLAAGRSALDASGGRIWVNTLEPRHAAGHVDEAALREPDAHWGRLIALGATIIQTDEPAALKQYLRSKGRR